MSKYLISSVLFLLAVSTSASSQDLDRLTERAGRLWAERLQGNKAGAAEFIEKEARSDFLMYETVREAKVTGLEFTADKSKIVVTTKAKVFFPTIGNIDQIITESWEWKAGNWFVHVAKGPFEMNRGAVSSTTVQSGFTFQLIDKKVDLGAHKQGDKISGTVKFSAPRSALQNIRTRGLDGFRVAATRWIDDKTGELDFTIDSSLIFQDINANVVLEAIGPERVFEVNSAVENLALVGRIEGKFGISQLPQTPEAEKGRFVELEIKNVGKTAFSVERIRPLDNNFVAPGSVIPPLGPGQAVKVMVSYGQAGLADGELAIQLSAGVLPSNSVLFRIKSPASVSAQQRPAGLTRAEIDAEVERLKQEALRRK
jgi:hypothetical protein